MDIFVNTIAIPINTEEKVDASIGAADIGGQMSGKIGTAFGGRHSAGKETAIRFIIRAFLIYGMIVAGNSGDTDGHYGVVCVDAPDVKAVKEGIKLDRRVALLVNALNQQYN